MDTPKPYMVPAENIGKLRERIAKLNKRAAKLGCEPITLAIGKPEIVEKTRSVKADGWRDHRQKVKCYPVTVEGSPPSYQGWTFLGTIQLIDGENIIRAVPGAEIPQQYRKATDWCDHCKSRRRRIDVFVVRHEDGRTLQVGRNCIADFLGHESPDGIVWRATILATINAEMDDWCESGRYGYPSIDLADYLTAAACAIRLFGFFKSASDSATKDTASDILSPPRVQHDRHGRPID